MKGIILAREAAAVAREIGASFIQILTDYVFDGSSRALVTEDAPTGPLDVYGRSKLAGEQKVRDANPDHLILQTAWPYSLFGRIFTSSIIFAFAMPDWRASVATLVDRLAFER